MVSHSEWPDLGMLQIQRQLLRMWLFWPRISHPGPSSSTLFLTQSNDSDFSGEATISFGPVKLSPGIKKNLMDTLSNRSIFIRGNILVSESLQKECQFKVFEDMIKICHCQSDLSYTFNYCVYEPRFEIIPQDSTKILILFHKGMGNVPDPFLQALFGHAYVCGQ